MNIKEYIAVIVTVAISSSVLTYWYPAIYNQANKITKRGDDIKADIDYVNTLLMFGLTVVYLVILLIPIHFIWTQRY